MPASTSQENPSSFPDEASLSNKDGFLFENDVSFIRGEHLFRLRAAAVILQDDAVLMVSNTRSPYLYSVGGAVQLGESLEDAVIREVQEETGLFLTVERLLAVHQNFFIDAVMGHHHWHELSFYFLMSDPGPVNLHSESHSFTGSAERLQWVPIKDFSEYNAYPLFFKDLPNLLHRNSPAWIVTHED